MVNENVVEESIISLLQGQGYDFADPSNDDWIANRKLDEFINEDLLMECLQRINHYPADILQEAIEEIKRIDNPSLFERNYRFHQMLIGGITIESKEYAVNPLVRLIDLKNPENNVFQVTHQIK